MSQSPDEEEDGRASPIYDYAQGEAEPENSQPWEAEAAAAPSSSAAPSLSPAAAAPHAAAYASIAASASIVTPIPPAPVHNHGAKRKADSAHPPLQAAAVFPLELQDHDENASTSQIQLPSEKHRRVADAPATQMTALQLPPAPPPPPLPPPDALEHELPAPVVAVHSVHKRKPEEEASRVALETADKRARVDESATAATAASAAAASAEPAEPAAASPAASNHHEDAPAARPPLRLEFPVVPSYLPLKDLDDYLDQAEIRRRNRCEPSAQLPPDSTQFAPLDTLPPYRPPKKGARPRRLAAGDAGSATATAAAASSSTAAVAAAAASSLPAHESWLATDRARSKLQFAWTLKASAPRVAPIRELEPPSRDLRVAPLIPLPPMQATQTATFNPQAPVSVFGRQFDRPLQQASEWCEYGFAQLARLLSDADQTQLLFLTHTKEWSLEDLLGEWREPSASLLSAERHQSFRHLSDQTWLALRQADAFLLLLNSFVVATCTEGIAQPHQASSGSSFYNQQWPSQSGASYTQQSWSSQRGASDSFPEFTPSARLGFILALNDGALQLFAALLAAPPSQGLGPSKAVLEFCDHAASASEVVAIDSTPPEQPRESSRPHSSSMRASAAVSAAAMSLSSQYAMLRLKALNEVLWLYDQQLLKYHVGAIRECKKKEEQQQASSAATTATAAAVRPSVAGSAAASSPFSPPIPAAPSGPPPPLSDYFPFFSFVEHAFHSLLDLAHRHPGVLRSSGSCDEDAAEAAEHKHVMRDDPGLVVSSAGAGSGGVKWVFDPVWATWLKLQESLRLVEYNLIFTPQSIDDRLASFEHLLVSPRQNDAPVHRNEQLRSYLESLRELKAAGCSPSLPSPEPPSLFWTWLRWAAVPLFDDPPRLPGKQSLHRPLQLHTVIIPPDRKPIVNDSQSLIYPLVQDDEVALMCRALDSVALTLEEARREESHADRFDELGRMLSNLSMDPKMHKSTCDAVLNSSPESSVLQRMESVLETAWMLLGARTHFELFDSGAWMAFKHRPLDSSSLRIHHPAAASRGVHVGRAAPAAGVVFTAISPFHLFACLTVATDRDLYDRSMSANAFVASLALNTDWTLFRVMFTRMRCLSKHCFEELGLFDRATTFSRFWLRMLWIQKISLLTSRNHAAESRFLMECLLSCDYFSPTLEATADGKFDPSSWALPETPTALMWEHGEATVNRIAEACYVALTSEEAELIDATDKKRVNVYDGAAVFLLSQQLLHGFLWRAARPLSHWSRLFALKHYEYTAPPTALTTEIVLSLERRALVLVDFACSSFVASVVDTMGDATNRAFHLEPLSIHIGAAAQPFFAWENGQRISPQAARNLVAMQRRCSVVLLLSSVLPLKQQAPLIEFLRATSVFVAPGNGELVLIPSEAGQRSECDLPLIEHKEETAAAKKRAAESQMVLLLDAAGNPVPASSPLATVETGGAAKDSDLSSLSSRHIAFTLYMKALVRLVELRQRFMDMHSAEVCRVFLNRAKVGSAPNLTPLQKESAGGLQPKHPFSLLKPAREEDPPVGDVWRWNFNDREARVEGSYLDVLALTVDLMQPCWSSFWHVEQKRVKDIDLNNPRTTTDDQKREEVRDRLLRRGRVRFLLSMMRQWKQILKQHQTDASWGLHDLELLQSKIVITAENGDVEEVRGPAAAAAGSARPSAAAASSSTPTLFLAQLLHVHHAHIRIPPALRRASLQVIACFLPGDPPSTGKHASETADEEKANEEDDAQAGPTAFGPAASTLPAPRPLTSELSDDAMVSALSAAERARPVSYAAMHRESRMEADIEHRRRELRAEYSAALSTILLAHFLAPIQQLIFCNLHDPNTWRLFSEAAAPPRRSDQIAAVARPSTLAALMAQQPPQPQPNEPIYPLADHLFKGEDSNLPLVAVDLLVKVAFLLTSCRRTTWNTVVDSWLPREHQASVVASIPSIRSITSCKVHKFADVASPLRESVLLRFYTQLLSSSQRNHEGALVTVPPLMVEAPQTYLALWIQSMIDVHLEMTQELNLYTAAILNYCELVNAAVLPVRTTLLTELFAPLMRGGGPNKCELKPPEGWQSGDSLHAVFHHRTSLLFKVLRAYAAKFSPHPIAIPGVNPAPLGQLVSASGGAINIFHSLHHLLRANVAKVLEGQQSDRERWTTIFSHRYIDFAYSFVGALCSTAADCLVPHNRTASLAVAQSLFNTAMVSQPFGTNSQEIWRRSFLVLGSVLRSVALLFPLSANPESIELSVMYRPSGAIGSATARSLLVHLWRHYLLHPFEPGVREHEKGERNKLILKTIIPQWINGLKPTSAPEIPRARLTQHTLLRRYMWAVFVGQSLFASVALLEGEVHIEVAWNLLEEIVWPVLRSLEGKESGHTSMRETARACDVGMHHS